MRTEPLNGHTLAAEHTETSFAAVLRELRRIRELLEANAAELLDAAAAARLLGVSQATLYRLRAAGRVPGAVRLGVGEQSIVRWRRVDLMTFVQDLRP